MSLRRRLFLTLAMLVLIGFFSIAKWISGELRDSYSQVVEEILVDYAHVISAHVENYKMSKAGFDTLQEVFSRYKSHRIQAKIFNYLKKSPSLDFYITDENGKVIFSTQSNRVGQDYSQWNDVYKTLRGEYGARSTRINSNDNRTSVYFVAAPIIIGSKIVGVATVFKSESSILVFLDRAMNNMFIGGLFSVAAIVLIGGLFMIWITLPLEKLQKYALDISEGHRGDLPISNVKEVRHLAEAFEKMRISLEGKRTIEKYTQTLTHELKSPLTAIKGAAELCLEEMDRNQQIHFLNNIIDESNRSHNLLEQLLKIAAIEAQFKLDQTVLLDPIEILNETKEALIGLWKNKQISIEINNELRSSISGDKVLLFQAFRNIVQNAIEFTGINGHILISSQNHGKFIKIEIRDDGVGIPSYAKERIFEKFYSLERPDTKRKSSGLGLSFVKEVIELHNGKISITSPVRDNKGTLVIIEIPNAH